MTNYSKVNLREIEDSSQSEGTVLRFSRKFLDSRDLGVTLAEYAPNVKSRGHSHKEQEEAYVLIKGTGSILVDDQLIELQPYDVVRVAPEAVRAFAAGPDGMEILAVGGPKPEGGDGVLVENLSWPE